jgi:hypothetical protein
VDARHEIELEAVIVSDDPEQVRRRVVRLED